MAHAHTCLICSAVLAVGDFDDCEVDRDHDYAACSEECAAAAGPEGASEMAAVAALPPSAPRETMMRASEIAADPRQGIRTVVDLQWDRRDHGQPWLVVERGHLQVDGYDVWTSTGRLVGTSRSLYGARQMASRALTRALRAGVGGRYDVVHRDEVAMTTSRAPHGCLAGEFSA